MPEGFIGKTSPATIAKFLGGTDFPCSKSDLITHASNKGAPDEIIDVLNKLPDTTYNSMADVMSGVGGVE